MFTSTVLIKSLHFCTDEYLVTLNISGWKQAWSKQNVCVFMLVSSAEYVGRQINNSLKK